MGKPLVWLPTLGRLALVLIHPGRRLSRQSRGPHRNGSKDVLCRGQVRSCFQPWYFRLYPGLVPGILGPKLILGSSPAISRRRHARIQQSCGSEIRNTGPFLAIGLSSLQVPAGFCRGRYDHIGTAYLEKGACSSPRSIRHESLYWLGVPGRIIHPFLESSAYAVKGGRRTMLGLFRHEGRRDLHDLLARGGLVSG